MLCILLPSFPLPNPTAPAVTAAHEACSWLSMATPHPRLHRSRVPHWPFLSSVRRAKGRRPSPLSFLLVSAQGAQWDPSIQSSSSPSSASAGLEPNREVEPQDYRQTVPPRGAPVQPLRFLGERLCWERTPKKDLSLKLLHSPQAFTGANRENSPSLRAWVAEALPLGILHSHCLCCSSEMSSEIAAVINEMSKDPGPCHPIPREFTSSPRVNRTGTLSADPQTHALLTRKAPNIAQGQLRAHS